MRAGGDRRARAVSVQAARSAAANRLRLARAGRIDQEGRQDPREPRQFHRGARRRIRPVERARPRTGPSSGSARSSAGSAIGRAPRPDRTASAPRISTGACGTAASRWLASLSVAARAAEISIRGARAPRARTPVSTGSSTGTTVDRQRPAVAQRVDRLRRAARGRRRPALRARTPSPAAHDRDGCVPVARVFDARGAPTACFARSGEAHM